MVNKSLHENAAQMKSLGELLAEYSYPKRMINEDDISCLKHRTVVVDGYEVVLYYSKKDYGGMILYLLSITGKYSPVLPFAVVCKCATAFLGTKELSLIEHKNETASVYNWMLLTKKNGKLISNSYVSDEKPTLWNELNFVRINNSQFVKFG